MKRRGGLFRYVTAGAAAAALGPTLLIVLHLPLWAGIVSAGLVFGGLSLALGPRRPFEGADLRKIGAGRLAVLRSTLEGAIEALDRIAAAASRIKERSVRDRVLAIERAGRGVAADLEKAPEGLSSVQRLLTYYIPNVAELAEGYAELEARGASADRRAAIAELLVKLEEAFSHYREQLAEQSLRALDVDMRLIGQALQEDVGAPITGSPSRSPGSPA